MVTQPVTRNAASIVGMRAPLAMVLVSLPWLAVVLLTSGAWSAFNFAAYALVVFAVGYGIIGATSYLPSISEAIVLAPAVGILTLSALTALWVRLGWPLVWVSALWVGLFAIGFLRLWRDRTVVAAATIRFGAILIFLSTAVCLVYLLPGAARDAVLRHDGSFNWMYVDTQYNYSIAESVRDSQGAPHEPGSVTVPLLYHFGGYAPAAA